MSQKKSIDAIIITRNEAPRLKRCLRALSFVDTIYVVDNDSTDDTVSIAKECGATVVANSGRDFGALRDIGAQKSHADWLLYIDADEFVSDSLREEILQKISNPSSLCGYMLKRQNYYMGSPWPVRDGMVRLIQRAALIKWEGSLHEHAVLSGKTGVLDNYLIHDTHRSLSEMTKKTNEWSEIEAQLRLKQNHPAIVEWRIFRVMCTGFFQSYIKERGITIGVVGLIESMFQGVSMFITYAKLWELQKK